MQNRSVLHFCDNDPASANKVLVAQEPYAQSMFQHHVHSVHTSLTCWLKTIKEASVSWSTDAFADMQVISRSVLLRAGLRD